MSDVKEIGVIGQKYEERTTGKVGTLESRDERFKTLMMSDEEGNGFSVSYSSFRSKWRKVKSDEVVSDKVEKVFEIKEVKEKVISDDEVIKNFNAENNGVKISEIADKVYSFVKNNFEIMRIKRNNDAFAIACLPDIFTVSSDRINDCVHDFIGQRLKSGLDVKFILNMTWSKMIDCMHDAIVDVEVNEYLERN